MPHGGGKVVAATEGGGKASALGSPGSTDRFRLQRKDGGEELSPARKGVAAAAGTTFTVGATTAIAGEIPIALSIRTTTPKIRLVLDFILSLRSVKNLASIHSSAYRHWKRGAELGVQARRCPRL